MTILMVGVYLLILPAYRLYQHKRPPKGDQSFQQSQLLSTRIVSGGGRPPSSLIPILCPRSFPTNKGLSM
jgi:hypothetical protein